MNEKINEVQKLMKKAEHATVLTGAGISAESGVPTFRGNDGLWQNYKAADLATPEAFSKDPELVWEFYNWRRALIDKVIPNAAHRALVVLENQVRDFTLITQNVDGLHYEAGNRNILEIHGNIWQVRCTECGKTELNKSELGNQPRCGYCSGLLRPNVVWFGEALDNKMLYLAIEACRKAEVMLVIGTSAVVQPAASLAMEAKNAGAILVEVNLEPTPHSYFMDFKFHGKAGEIVPKLMEDWD